jgi:hypothetical protein
VPATKGDAQDLQWVEIDNFSPGIITNSDFANPVNEYPVPGSQVGQAQSAQGCIALPNGGLAPLPGLASTTPWGATAPIAPIHTLATGVGSKNLIAGLFLNGPLYYYGGSSPYPQSTGDELIIGQSQITSAGNQLLWIDSVQGDNINLTSTITTILTEASATSRLNLCTMTGGTTRANTTPSDVGIVCWALSYWFTAGTASAPTPGTWQYLLYPDPTAVPTFNFNSLINSSGGPGEILCHQNRVVCMQWIPTSYTTSSSFAGGNETWTYTDPPNGVALLGSSEVFVQEDPNGYGAWGSQSASELFLVKNMIGGVVIQGDLNSPTVTVLPGVTPTYGLMSRGASTTIGFVYASQNRGVWAWNGSNVSTKISAQLEDNFMVNTHLPAIERGPTVDIQRWGEWIIVTNDWLYDTIGQGWWRLPPGTNTLTHQWYQSSSDGSTLFAAFGVPTASAAVDCYTLTKPTHTFNWTSYPIRPPTATKNRSLDIREIVVRAQGMGTVEVTLVGLQGTTGGVVSPSATLSFETTPDFLQPSMQRITGGLDAQDVTVTITSTGESSSTAAPIVYSVAIGYVETPAKVSSG